MVKKHNILSPDGITISQENFDTEELAIEFYEQWKERYVAQGYYSAVGRRIPIDELKGNCELIEI